jgi:hypothetical protein
MHVFLLDWLAEDLCLGGASRLSRGGRQEQMEMRRERQADRQFYLHGSFAGHACYDPEGKKTGCPFVARNATTTPPECVLCAQRDATVLPLISDCARRCKDKARHMHVKQKLQGPTFLFVFLAVFANDIHNRHSEFKKLNLTSAPEKLAMRSFLGQLQYFEILLWGNLYVFSW